MEIRFLGQCGFWFRCDEFDIMIDPVLADMVDNGVSIRNYPPVINPADVSPTYVLCTHDHIDHLNVDTVKAIAEHSKKTLFVVPKGCVPILTDIGIAKERIVPAYDGCSLKLEHGIKLKAFSTAHPTHSVDENGLDHNLGYALTINGRQYVHLGDTYRTGRMFKSLTDLGKIDILFSPINGRDEERESRGIIGNLSSAQTLELALDLKVRLLVPTHFDMVNGNTERIENFTALAQGRIKYAIPLLMQDIL